MTDSFLFFSPPDLVTISLWLCQIKMSLKKCSCLCHENSVSKFYESRIFFFSFHVLLPIMLVEMRGIIIFIYSEFDDNSFVLPTKRKITVSYSYYNSIFFPQILFSTMKIIKMRRSMTLIVVLNFNVIRFLSAWSQCNIRPKLTWWDSLINFTFLYFSDFELKKKKNSTSLITEIRYNW